MSLSCSRHRAASFARLAAIAVAVCLAAAALSAAGGDPAAASPSTSGLARWIPDLHGLAKPGLYALTFAVAFIGGVIPFVINVEVYQIAVLALTDVSSVAVVVLLTLGQVLAKWILYESGKGVFKFKWIRRERMDRAAAAFERHGNRAMVVVFASASLGFPPLYGVALLAGTLRLPLRPFLTVTTAGRLLRFGVLALGPWLFGRLS